MWWMVSRAGGRHDRDGFFCPWFAVMIQAKIWGSELVFVAIVSRVVRCGMMWLLNVIDVSCYDDACFEACFYFRRYY